MKQLLIKNGLVVTANEESICDVLCEGEKILRIEKDIGAGPETEIIDAAGKVVIPGGIDVHTHLCLDTGSAVASDDFYSGTVAAACGGVTSLVDHPGFGPSGCSLDHQIKKYHGLAEGKAVIDYGFHGVVQHVDDDVLARMESLAEEGITSFKLYLTYGYKLADADVYKALRRAKDLGVLIAVHPENDGVISLLREEFRAAGKVSARYHPLSRPDGCEAEAVNRMLLFAKIADNAPLYIVHVSCALALEFIEAALRRGQKNLWAETCPQYLYLDDSLYSLPGNQGLKFIMSPPLRTPADNAALWRGLPSSLSVIGTDHCPFFFETQKMAGKDNFTACPGGAPGIEERIPLMYDAAVKGRISLRRFTELCCSNPAKIFGMYPQKGVIAPGSDADMVILDPGKKTVITQKNLHSNVDYSAYEGCAVQGWPVCTISRGEVIVTDGKFTGSPGRGKFIKRRFPPVGSEHRE